MLRLTGSALILGAVLWLQRSFHLRTLLRQRTLRALSGAFLALESAVRLTLTPLPALLRHLSCEPEAAGFFEGVTANLARGEPLASAWEHAAKTLPIAAGHLNAFLSCIQQRTWCLFRGSAGRGLIDFKPLSCQLRRSAGPRNQSPHLIADDSHGPCPVNGRQFP